MLHSYKFRNFQSFLDKTEVSFVLNNKVPQRGWECLGNSGQRLTTALGTIGANGAGKTALLKPLAFYQWFISESFASRKPGELIPITPHFAALDEPTDIEVEMEDRTGTVWRYVLSLTTERVIHEALYRKQERFTYVFRRDWSESSGSYDIRQQGFGLSAKEAAKVRQNASLISTAAQYGVKLANDLISQIIVSNVSIAGRHYFESSHLRIAAELFATSEPLRLQMANLLMKWDLGLDDVVMREVPREDEKGEVVKTWVAFGVHNSCGKTVEISMEGESSGTQAAFVLLARILYALAVGGIAVIDELDSDLHPLMVEPILELFTKKSTNPKNAQIIFTCHTSEILDLLQKSQVIFVEKTNCQSIGYRGDDIQGLRSDDNFRAKYMSGALGAVPQI